MEGLPVAQTISNQRERKRKISWVERGRLFWPAEIQENSVGAPTWLNFLGPKKSRESCDQVSVMLPFSENMNRLSKQTKDRDFVQAVIEAVHLSQTGEEIDELPIERNSEDVKHTTIQEDGSSAPETTIHVVNDSKDRIAVGSRVRIISHRITEKLQLDDEEAVIIHVPMRASTWHTVRLRDGRTLNIRRNALEAEESKSKSLIPVTSQNAKSRNSEVKQLPSRPSLYRRNAPRDSKLKRKLIIEETTQSPKRRKPHPKSRGGKSNLVGKHVIIECGRYKGESGYVIRGGNGYYCIQLGGPGSSGRGNVMKRSADLREIPFPTDGNGNYKGSQSQDSNRHEFSSSSSGNCKGESWVNRKVYVKSGKHQGKVGTIRRSGHGFYCVSIPSVGDVMKRASDLELCSRKETKKNVKSLERPSDDHSALEQAAFILLNMRKPLSIEQEPEKQKAIDLSSLRFDEGVPPYELKTPILKSENINDEEYSRWVPKEKYNTHLKLPHAKMRRKALVSQRASISQSLSTFW
mmetsp:Transcript_9661/g.14473  ORF Transcript_9661/g.14473 Transcript_9661/m.14473 type:complete len:521 (+) Transcript_9661:106-1668(+)